MAVVASAYQSTQALYQGIQSFLTLKERAAVDAKAVELLGLAAVANSKLLEVQSSYATALDRIRELESKVADLQKWDLEKSRYTLCESSPGTYTYRLNPSDSQGEPMHELCPQCFENGVKSILQAAAPAHGHKTLACPRCKSTLQGERIVAKASFVISRERRDWSQF